jgi:hypothetical protein
LSSIRTEQGDLEAPQRGDGEIACFQVTTVTILI